MTNGEKMQAAFPDIEMWGESKDTLDYSLGGMIHRVTKSWWNAEYKEPRWIPVSERLPKAGEYVGDVAKYYLVQNEYGDMLVARYSHSEYWEQIYQLKPYTDEIVAWMPLPKAYREVEK